VPAGCGSTSCFITLVSNTSHNQPQFLSVDATGAVYLSDFEADTLTQIPAGCTTSACMNLVGNLQVPYQVAADQFGNVYVSDYEHNQSNHYVYEEEMNAVNLGSVSFGSTSAIFSLFFNFASATTLGSINALTQGATLDASGNALDFAVVSGGTCAIGAPAAGSRCYVNVQFTPKGLGLRSGALVLKDASSNILSTAYIYGNGKGPQASFTGYSLAPVVANAPAKGSAIKGRVMGGQQPVGFASVQLWATSTTGYGTASTPATMPGSRTRATIA